jgi:hypothetical protein
MPRRTGRRCPERTGAKSELDAAVAWELVVWRGLDIVGMGLASATDFEISWREHGNTILRDYIDVMPGSRPFGLYATGHIPAPAITVAPYGHDLGRRIGERVFFDARCYGHADEPELVHLVALGVVGPDEARLARRRLKEHGCRQLYSHRPTPAGVSHHAEAGTDGRPSL